MRNARTYPNALGKASILPQKAFTLPSMGPLRRIFLFLWFLLRDLPLISPGRLLMPGVFVVGWMTFKAIGWPEDLAFVWAGVLAQATHLWAVIPVSVFRQRHAFGRAKQAVTWAVTISFCVLVFQIWWCEPWMSQRVVSVYCAFYAAGMVLGVLGDRDVVKRTVPVTNDVDVPLVFRRHLLKLYTLVAVLIIATNEALLAVDAALNSRVAILSLLPVVLHYFFEITLRLTYPSLDEHDA